MAKTSIRGNVATGYPDLLTANSVSAGLPTTAKAVGAKAFTGDGREYIWAYDGGTALVAGKVYQSPAEDDTNLHDLTLASVAVGDTSVSVTSTASTIAANALAGGFLVLTASGGKGDYYSISGNTAAAASAFTIQLSDPIRVAATTPTADVSLNPYNGVILMPATATGAAVGVAAVATSGTQYAWLQTKGVCAVKNDGTATINPGDYVGPSIGTTGTVRALTFAGTTAMLTSIGVALETIEGTEWGFVQLNIQ